MGRKPKFQTEEERIEARRGYRRKHYEKHKEQERERAKKNYIRFYDKIRTRMEILRMTSETNPKRLISEMTNAAKGRSKRRGIEFNITKEDIEELFTKSDGRCAISGMPLDTKLRSKMKVSIDRIDPNKGYVVGNLQLAATCVNVAKSNLSQDEFVAMCKAVVAFNS